MNRYLFRGVSFCALTLALAAAPARAQQTLPSINIGGVARPHPGAPSGRAAPAPSARVVVAPAPRAPAAPKPSYRDAPVTSSSTRSFTGDQVLSRPFAQPAEALEIVPGLIVSQHSGSGKANQYFLRGFALDHGNDLALTLDGMPLNMPSHGHGQGYADANFIIPELFSAVDVRKGPYFADEGVFASAGAVHMQYVDRLPEGLLSVTGGSFGWARSVVAKSWDIHGGSLLAAVEGNHYNGPWEIAENSKKLNGVIRWSRGTQDNGLSITGMAYSNHWNATDQIPGRLVDQGLLSRWGTLDPTQHGNSNRYSVSARWSEADQSGFSRVEGFAIRTALNLWDMTTGILEHPDLGDQFHSFDRRSIFGLNALHGWNYHLGELPVETRVGLQGRYDDIRNGLQDSFQRNAFDQPRDDYIKQGNVSLWTDTTLHWTPWLRTYVGGRFDYMRVAVNSIQTPFNAPRFGDLSSGLCFGAADPENCLAYTGFLNSGTKGQTMGSPKAGLVLGPFQATEFYLNFGEGLQGSDARGVVARLDPHNGTQFGEQGLVTGTPLLVKTRGAEAGLRTRAIDGLDTSLTFFWQDFDSENLFEGDEGTTTFGRPSRRLGLEWTGAYRPTPWLRMDAEVTAAHSRFRGSDDVQKAGYLNTLRATDDPLYPFTIRGASPGDFLTNAPTIVATGGIEVGEAKGWFGGLRYRYFGSRPLTEDGQLKSIAAGTLNLRVGYRFDNGWKIQADAFNVTNNRGDAIAYGYGSFTRQDLFVRRHPLGAESAGIMDRHFKPIDPPAFRVTLSGPLTIFDGPITANPARF